MKFILAYLNSYTHGRSGGDMVFVEIASRLEDKGHGFKIVTSLLGKELCEEVGAEANYFMTTREKAFKNIVFTYLKRVIVGVYYALKIPDSKIVLATSDFLPDVFPSISNKIFSKSVYIQHIFHVINKERPFPYYSQKLSFFLIKKFADAVIVDNNLLVEDLVSLGFCKKKIYVNYPGIRLSYLNQVTLRDSGFDGVFMAQLRESKGIFDLVEIWDHIVKTMPKAKLGILGKGNEQDTLKLKNMIKEASLEGNIELLGFLPDDEAFSLIRGSKVCVFPSHEEGFGIVPLECQALGLPVVAWDLPVFSEIFPKGMVKLQRPSYLDFANEVIKLINEKDYYEHMSVEAVENAKRFDWDLTAERQEEIFKKVLNEN